MKKTYFIIAFSFLLFLSGCASYHASKLTALDPQFVKEYQELDGISIGCKEYSQEDCRIYLDRDVLKKGFQPLQLTFYNTSDQNYIFYTSCLSLPCISPEEVAKFVKTSTTGRVLGYTAGALLFTPLAFSAIIDGIKSHHANNQLVEDFQQKAKRHLVLSSNSFIKTLVFIPVDHYRPIFDLTLIDEKTGAQKTVSVYANREK